MKGFTLIEIMIAITIVAVLATIGLVTYMSAQKNTRDSKRVQDLQEIQKAAENFYIANSNTYPATLGAMNSYFQSTSAPNDPIYTGTNNYNYFQATCSGGHKYIVCAKLESCFTKCNRSSLPADACAAVSDTTPPSSATTHYCVGSLNN